ncbi:MAG: class I SAM-dependent methyltransferase [Planctomycetes bacterium]|nr:class I SAM-dependent methyltransferase [Planctomycetota bacterium]
MSDGSFDPVCFYQTYPGKVMGRPGYPARAVFKSTLLFHLYGEFVFRDIGRITTYADIGGCFGFGANAMGFHIGRRQGLVPKTTVFEMASDFVRMGEQLFPHIEFVEADFRHWRGEAVFDLVTLFDVVEHVCEPASFLQHVAAHSQYVMLKTPMQTAGEYRAPRPPVGIGASHRDGHVNFFSPREYEQLLRASGLEIVARRLVESIVPAGARMALLPEDNAKPVGLLGTLRRPRSLARRAFLGIPLVPFAWKRKIVGGGSHLCLCVSRCLH